MCGISGFNFKDQDLIAKMNNKIHHRGPDAEGFYIDENVSLGHRRLSIIDLSDAGRQPIYNEDKNLVIIFNGEIYNYQELRRDLSTKHKFYTKNGQRCKIHAKYEEKINLLLYLEIILFDYKNLFHSLSIKSPFSNRLL